MRRTGTRLERAWHTYSFTATIAGSAAGTITKLVLLDEATIEDSYGSHVTIMRVIGDIYVNATAGDPFLWFTLWGGPVTGGSGAGQLAVDDVEDPRCMWRRSWADFNSGSSVALSHIPVDVRAKRKLARNCELALKIDEHRLAVGNDWEAAGLLNILVGH